MLHVSGKDLFYAFYSLNSHQHLLLHQRFYFCYFSALKQAMAAYFQEESIGDVGGKKAKYVPKRGHPGTLVGSAIMLSYGCL